MKINDIVILRKHDEYHHRGVIGNKYVITELKKTEIRLCAEDALDFCFYTSPNNVEVVRSTVPGYDPTYEDQLNAENPVDDDWLEKRSEIAFEDFSNKLDTAASDIVELLKNKNKAYGNTALSPVKIFSRLDATEALCARIDDKIMRIKNKGINDQTEDTVDDLIGYLLLLKMSMS